MNVFNLIEIEWNCYNGLIISLLHLNLNNPCIDSSLIGIYVSSRFLYIDILFFSFKIFEKP